MTIPEFAKHDDTMVKQVWIKKSNPQQPYKSFEEMIRACPECSVDNGGEPWICLDESDWVQWVDTGIRPDGLWIV